jgi:hypothetical protein
VERDDAVRPVAADAAPSSPSTTTTTMATRDGSVDDTFEDHPEDVHEVDQPHYDDHDADD